MMREREYPVAQPHDASVPLELDWEKVSASLYASAKRMQAEQLKQGGNVSTVILAVSALIMNELARAIRDGLQK